MMSGLGKRIIPSSWLSTFLPYRSNGRQFRPTRAKKPSIGENSQAKGPTFSLRISKAFVARSAVAVFALGFLDAGYSGDWSRIGVITKETEELLKIAAYLITPFCLFLIISITDEDKAP